MTKLGELFSWQGGGAKKRYHLIKWEIICKSKKKGGPGIKKFKENECQTVMYVVVEVRKRKWPRAGDH